MGTKLIDRELSWLDFNYRVLQQAARKEVPLLERLRFLGIANNNLNEFISVRFSNVLEGFLSNKKVVDDLGNSDFEKKYSSLLPAISKFKDRSYKVYESLMKEMKDVLGVSVYEDSKNLSRKEKKFCEEYFENNILPILYPVMYDVTKDMPILDDGELHFLVKLSNGKNDVLCFLPIPKQLDRIVEISENKFIFVEEIVKMNLSSIFVKKKIDSFVLFKTYRFISDSEFARSDNFIVERMQKYLKVRDLNNNKVMLDIQADKDDDLVKTAYKVMDVYKGHVYTTKHPLALSCLMKLFYEHKKHMYSQMEPSIPNEIIGEDGIFNHLLRDDILLQHPYESFDMVIDFINEAATDKGVLSIKQTLYRVSSEDSPLINALCNAAERGKKVVILLELTARFDEKQNLALIKKLSDAGCTLIYGMEGYKVHCKMCIITKVTKKGLKIFSHFGTGNYNDKTAKVYTDISYMTSSNGIGKGLNDVFNMISGCSSPKTNKNVFHSPGGIRKHIVSLIEREMKHVKAGKKGKDILKINSLCDRKMIKVIQKAANAGVHFEIICRGVCSLTASANISIKSIVGRFLEHSRIYSFYNNGDEEIYIASADLLTRNLDRRVETMLRIKDERCAKKISNILKAMHADEFNSYHMTTNGVYMQAQGKINCHNFFMNPKHRSLKLPKKMKKG